MRCVYSNRARVRNAGAGRRGLEICGLALAAATSACGGDPGIGSPSLDAASGAPMIMIQTFPEPFPYGSHPENADYLLFQDGDGPWNQLHGTNGTYSAYSTTGRYTVATICGLGTDTLSFGSVVLYYLGVSDTTRVQLTGCVDTRSRVHVTAQLNGIPSGQQGEVYFGGTLGAQATGDSPFKADVVRGEPVDVLVSSLIDNVPQKVYRGPALDGLADQTLQYDVGALGAPPESQPLEVTGLDPMDNLQVQSFLSTRPSQASWFVDLRPFSTTPPDHFSSVPVAAGRQPDDITEVSILVASAHACGVEHTLYRSVNAMMKTPAATTLALPAPWCLENPTFDTTALHRATLTLPEAPAGSTSIDYTAQLSSVGGSHSRSWDLTIGAGWLAGRGAVTLTTPDLDAVIDAPITFALPADRDVFSLISRFERNFDYAAAKADGMLVTGNQIIATIHAPPPVR